jgi:hypothetical protein
VNVEVSFFLWVKFMLTQESLKEVLSYDSETGIFIRLLKTYNRVKVGDVMGTLTSDGYYLICINSKLYKSHRLAWLYMTGSMPKHQIDHINGIRSDNRFCNLREATNAGNGQNRIKCHSNNKSTGLLGSHFDKRKNKFMAKIQINYKFKFLGYFNTAEEAHNRYIQEKRIIHPYGEM